MRQGAEGEQQAPTGTLYCSNQNDWIRARGQSGQRKARLNEASNKPCIHTFRSLYGLVMNVDHLAHGEGFLIVLLEKKTLQVGVILSYDRYSVQDLTYPGSIRESLSLITNQQMTGSIYHLLLTSTVELRDPALFRTTIVDSIHRLTATSYPSFTPGSFASSNQGSIISGELSIPDGLPRTVQHFWNLREPDNRKYA